MNKKISFFLLALFTFTFTLINAQKYRQVISINSNWKFKTGIQINLPATNDYDDSSWDSINIPHTWNNIDGQDGGTYVRTNSWYRKHLNWDDRLTNKKVFLEFLGVNMQCDVFVNNQLAGTHKGGYTAFRFDITDKLTVGENIIAIKVNNQEVQDIAPITADFTFFGGIYRNVSLIVTSPVHIDLMDNGSPGLYLTTKNVSKTAATLEIKSKVLNETTESKTLNLKAVLRYPDSFEELTAIKNPTFDIATMKPGGAALQYFDESITIPAGGSYDFKTTFEVSNPRLWNGKSDPFRYLVDFSVSEGNQVIDAKSEYVGFRFFQANSNGFFLNGNFYPLRGVNRHQDRRNKGNAIGKAEHDEDFAIIYEMGANTIRLAHYPQDSYFYDLCDRYGIVVWAEIPFVNHYGSLAEFPAVTKQQLVEMIRQQYNRPSILMWGLQNEVFEKYDAQMRTFMKELNDLAHTEDPSRYTVQASNHGTAYNWPSDLMAWNTYPGWYGGGTLLQRIDGFIGQNQPTGISEYGAGGSIFQHELNPKQPVTTGIWHPEEYQTLYHERAIADINKRPKMWGTYLWNMFDFAADKRSEGDQMGMNDKGTVTYDRMVKKDSYFVYKVNWNAEPMTYITRRRFNPMPQADIPVILYSNCESVELFLNGVSIGTKLKSDAKDNIYKWDNITLQSGENTVIAKGKIGNTEYNDTVKWTKAIGNTCELSSTELTTNNVSRKIVLKESYDYSDLISILHGTNNATYKIYQNDGTTEITSGLIIPGMKAIVTAEDGVTKATFDFVSDHLALGKPVFSDSQQAENPAANAVDMNGNTRWAAADGGVHYIEVDLGDTYNLDNVTITWFNNVAKNRYYKYTVLIGDDKKQYAQAIDRTNNTTIGVVTDKLSKKTGRWIKINVTGSNDTGAYPSIYEIEVYGWKLNSSTYEINHETKIISVPNHNLNNVLPTGTFLENIKLIGQGNLSLNSVSYFIQNGDKLLIKNSNNDVTEYTIQGADRVIQNISERKNTTTSGQEGVDDAGEKNLVSYINDSKLETRWAAPKRNGLATYPEWAIIDLGKIYNISEIELHFYKWGENNRWYGYELLTSTTNNAPTNFTQITDAKSNNDLSGHYIHKYTNQKARYVKVNVTSVSLNANWAQASIHEMIVRGYEDAETGLNDVKLIDMISTKNNTLSLQLSNSFKKAKIELIDVTGRIIYNKDITGNFEKRFDPGVYLLRITGDRGIQTIKCKLY